MGNNMGWIKLYRKIEQCSLYFSEPFTRMQAWIDLLLIANHDEKDVFIRGNMVIVHRGEIARSSENLAQRWKWSRGKVLRFLDYLEEMGMIVQQKSFVTSTISICNYSKYQDNDTADSTADSTADGQQIVQQTDTNKNIKKEKKDKEEKKKTYTKDFEDAWEAYKRKGNKKDAYIQWQKLTDEEKEAAAIHIPFYVRSREIQYLKDFQRYLSHHQFEEVVRGEKGEDMFDPSRTTAGEYNPDNSLHSDVGFGWDFGYVCKNEHRDPYKDMIFDGYTNDTRPDGALLYFKNGLRYHRWDAQAKVWRKVEGHWDREKRMFIEEGQQ